MNFNESVEYIHSLLQFGIKPGLGRISMLLEMLDNPQDKIKTVHIAGTNGKGTTSTHLANILTSAGYKTGLYTSPYVLSFCERIQIDGNNIPKDDLARTVTRVKSEIEKLNEQGIIITEFEALTATAFLYFYESGCNYAVIEVGLGGRFDATNVIKKPEAVVITSISLDHTKILGDTIPQIAYEKCGVIKYGVTVITSKKQTEQALGVISKTTTDKNCKLIVANPQNAQVIFESLMVKHFVRFAYDGNEYTLYLMGEHQIENAVNVIETARVLGIDDRYIQEGLAKTTMLARMEVISEEPLIIRDGGHNEGCANALHDFLTKYKVENINMLIGLMADKDCESYVSKIAPLCKSVVTVTPSNPRALDSEKLKEIAEKYCDNVKSINNPKEGYKYILSNTKKDETILVCGSFYMMSDIFGE